MINKSTLRDVMAKDPYVESERIWKRGSQNAPRGVGQGAHLVAPDLLLVISFKNGLHQVLFRALATFQSPRRVRLTREALLHALLPSIHRFLCALLRTLILVILLHQLREPGTKSASRGSSLAS